VCVLTRVGTNDRREVAVFVQMADGGPSPRAMCTTVRLTDGGQLVLSLDDGYEQLVLVRRGRYEMPVLEARAGRYWELTLAAPGGERIMLQFDRAGTQMAPPPEEGDGAIAAV
jgi:hypothetical protein